MFIFGGSPWLPIRGRRTTPAPTSNAYDTNNVLTPFGELYAAWDDDANVETNKAYYIHNSGTRKIWLTWATRSSQMPKAFWCGTAPRSGR